MQGFYEYTKSLKVLVIFIFTYSFIKYLAECIGFNRSFRAEIYVEFIL